LKTINLVFLALLLTSILFSRCSKDSDSPAPEQKETRISAYYVENNLVFKFYYNELTKISKIEALNGTGTIVDAATYEYDTEGDLKKKITGTAPYGYKSNEIHQIIESTYMGSIGPAIGSLFEVRKTYTYDESGRIKDIKSYNKDDDYIYQTRYEYFDNGSLKLVEKYRQPDLVGGSAKRMSRMDFTKATPGDQMLFEQLHRSLVEPAPIDFVLMQLTDQILVREYQTDGAIVKNETKYEMNDRKYEEPDGFLESQQTQVTYILPAKAPQIVKYKYEYIKL